MENIFILLYVKMVNGVSEGTGENEFRELDHKERMRREAKKILKGKIYTRATSGLGQFARGCRRKPRVTGSKQ